MKIKKIVLMLSILIVISLFLVSCEEETEVEEIPTEVSTEEVPVKEESEVVSGAEKDDDKMVITPKETKEKIGTEIKEKEVVTKIIKEEMIENQVADKLEEEIKEEPQKYELDLNVKEIPKELDEFSKYFTKYVNVFGINIFSSWEVSDNRILHTANVMAEYLDNDEDGYLDNQLIVDKMVELGASMVIFESDNKLENSGIWDSDIEKRYKMQDLYEGEINLGL